MSELKKATAKLKNCCAVICLMDSKQLAWNKQTDKPKTAHTECDLPWSHYWNEKAKDSGIRECLKSQSLPGFQFANDRPVGKKNPPNYVYICKEMFTGPHLAMAKKNGFWSVAANTAVLEINETFCIFLHPSCIDIVFVGTPNTYNWGVVRTPCQYLLRGVPGWV